MWVGGWFVGVSPPQGVFGQGGAAPLHPPLALKSESKLFVSALEARLAPVISAVFVVGFVETGVDGTPSADDPASSL